MYMYPREPTFRMTLPSSCAAIAAPLQLNISTMLSIAERPPPYRRRRTKSRTGHSAGDTYRYSDHVRCFLRNSGTGMVILYGYVWIAIDNIMENVVFAEEKDQLLELLDNSVRCILFHRLHDKYDFVLSHEITSLFGLWLPTHEEQSILLWSSHS